MAQTSGPTTIYPLRGIINSLLEVDVVDSLHCPLSYVEDEEEKSWQLRLFFTPLIHAVKHETDHLHKLDDQLSKLLTPTSVKTQSHYLRTADSVNDEVLARVGGLLARLPRTPQRNLSLPLNNGLLKVPGKALWDGIRSGTWASRYILPDSRDLFIQPLLPGSSDAEMMWGSLNLMQDLAWDHMCVTTHIDSNSVVLATAIIRADGRGNAALAVAMSRYVDLLSMLVDEFNGLNDAVKLGNDFIVSDPSPEVQELKIALFVSHDTEGSHLQAFAVLKVFLWTAWQRAVMLYVYYVIGVQLKFGYSSAWNSRLAVRGVYELMSLRREDYRGSNVPYLCNWAFELLRTGRSSIALDFRGLLRRFGDHFQNREARCVKGSKKSCEGGQPESCQRFTAAVDKSQSAHSHLCDRLCDRVVWSKHLYVTCPLPRATIADLSCAELRYCPVANHTLAISHVWSHGQGGRPETGINRCLHQRYCRLAKTFGCEAYWIDSTCIPRENPMRREAIQNINKIFAEAKATLVIDADVQSVDISFPSVTTYETLLCIFLVCDWNVRAWTLLEAVRGSRSVFLLCSEDAVVSLREILLQVHARGAIDIAVLLGSAQHLLPQEDPSPERTIEEASNLLSQRHCSWPGDEVICWSLLNNESGSGDPVDLWRAQMEVRTGYLVSTASRIHGVPGLGWAPRCPYVRPTHRSVELPDGRRQDYKLRVPSYDGEGSFVAQISISGLSSRWHVMDITRAILETSRENFLYTINNMATVFEQDPHAELDDPRIQEVFAHPDSAKLFLETEVLLQAGAQVRLLRALAEDGLSPYQGSARRGEEFGLAAVLCASYDAGMSWHWHDVYEWQEPDNYEAWKIQDMLLV